MCQLEHIHFRTVQEARLAGKGDGLEIRVGLNSKEKMAERSKKRREGYPPGDELEHRQFITDPNFACREG